MSEEEQEYGADHPSEVSIPELLSSTSGSHSGPLLEPLILPDNKGTLPWEATSRVQGQILFFIRMKT